MEKLKKVPQTKRDHAKLCVDGEDTLKWQEQRRKRFMGRLRKTSTLERIFAWTVFLGEVERELEQEAFCLSNLESLPN